LPHPFEALADFGFSGAEVAHGIAEASRFADADHTGRARTTRRDERRGRRGVGDRQRLRAIEAGAHAYCARNGRYSR